MTSDWTPSDAADAEDDRRRREWWRKTPVDEAEDEEPDQ